SSPLQGGGSVTVGTLCVNTFSGLREIAIDYLDANGAVICTSVMSIPCNHLCCESLIPRFIPYDPGFQDASCCFTMELDPVCPLIRQVRLTSLSSGKLLDPDDPGAPAVQSL